MSHFVKMPVASLLLLPPPLLCLHLWWDALGWKEKNRGCAICEMRKGAGFV